MKRRPKFPFPRKKKMPTDNVTLSLTPALLNTIVNALAAMPFKDAVGPINEIQRQVQAQTAPPMAVPRPMAAVPSQPEVAEPVGKSG